MRYSANKELRRLMRLNHNLALQDLKVHDTHHGTLGHTIINHVETKRTLDYRGYPQVGNWYSQISAGHQSQKILDSYRD